jgi:hypothetical protein
MQVIPLLLYTILLFVYSSASPASRTAVLDDDEDAYLTVVSDYK